MIPRACLGPAGTTANANFTAEFLTSVPQIAMDFGKTVTRDSVALMENCGTPFICRNGR